MKAKKTMIPTSIGPLNIKACGRDYFNVTSAAGTYPLVLFSIERHKDGWKLPSGHIYGLKGGKEGQASPALIDEIFTLGTRWADANPKKFERSGRKEYRQIVESITGSILNLALTEIRETRKDLRSVLQEPEFMRQAPAKLRALVQDAAKMLQTAKKQINAAGKAIDAAHQGSGEVA